MLTQQSLTVDGMVPGRRYWITFQSLENPDSSSHRGSFIDTFLTLRLIDKQLHAVFTRQDAVDVRCITGIVEAV